MERKLTAILSTDVNGYSRLMGEDEEATIQTLKSYRGVITSLVEQHHGRVVDSPGDNMLAEFASVVDAVKSAVAIQQELKVRNADLEAHRKMEFRIGLNVGDVVTDEARLYGDGVNIAARLESLADPGGICISGTVYDQIANKLDVPCTYQGEQTVKNIAKPVRAYKVQLEPDGTAPSVGLTRSAFRSAAEKGPLRRRSMATVGVVAVLLMGTGALVFRTFSPQLSSPSKTEPAKEAPALPLPDKPSIAVLPFTNMSGDPEQEYFSDGLTDGIITDLSKISGLFVIASNSTFAYKGQAVDVREIGREFGVRYVLEGSTQKAKDQVRVDAQLVEAATRHHIWSESYDRSLTDFFAVQDDIVQQIGATLRVEIVEAEQERVQRIPTENLTAHDALLRGRKHYLRWSKEANLQARKLFERAIELDPRYAAAYAWLSMTYYTEWSTGWGTDPQYLVRAFKAAQRAIALDGSLPWAHGVLSQIYLFRKQHELAIAEAEQHLALDPNDAAGYIDLAHILSYASRPEETIELVKKAMRLNPHYPAFYLWVLGRAYNLTGRYEEALLALERAAAAHPDLAPIHFDLAVVYSKLGKSEKAHMHVQEIRRLNPAMVLEAVTLAMPFQDQAVLKRFVDDLRKAGLPSAKDPAVLKRFVDDMDKAGIPLHATREVEDDVPSENSSGGQLSD